MMDLYDGQKLTRKKSGDMDKVGCGSRRIRFFWYFAKITLWWNSVKLWTIDIGLWY